MSNTPDSPAWTPGDRMDRGGGHWAPFTPGIRKGLHAVLHAWGGEPGLLFRHVFGAWNVELINPSPGNSECLLSHTDAPPPDYARKFSFLLTTDRKGIAVIISDKMQPPQKITGSRTFIQFGEGMYEFSTSPGIPLSKGMPGGMILGRLLVTDYFAFMSDMGRSPGGRLVLADGTVWNLNMIGMGMAIMDFPIA